MTLTLPLSLLIVHTVADFVFQTDKMAINKSKSMGWLSLHCLVYAMCFVWLGFTFSIVTFMTHFLTDAITSRITGRLWFIQFFEPQDCPRKYEPKNYPNPFLVLGGYQFYAGALVFLGLRHWFFVVIGLDQLIHFTTLALTYRWLIG